MRICLHEWVHGAKIWNKKVVRNSVLREEIVEISGPSFVAGPVAILINEDDSDLDGSIDHHRGLGFANIVVVTRPRALPQDVSYVLTDPTLPLDQIVNALLPALDGRWVFTGYNAEYLFFPFCEARSIADVAQFVTEERRNAVFGITLDLYPSDRDRDMKTIERDDALFDPVGYYALDRFDGPDRLERQIDVFGGLKWRFAEHVPWPRQRIDRIALFRARKEYPMTPALLFGDAEMNTVSCPWHNNLTMAVPSFRVAKSLVSNPGSTFDIAALRTSSSQPFGWTSDQLMQGGFMEPGQWF